MMRFALLKKKAHSLFDHSPWLANIQTEAEYALALRLMEELIEDYEGNLALIEILSVNIERWENTSRSFSAFNQKVKALDSAVSLLEVLMEQNQLGIADLPEIGSKSLISKILNGHCRLTLDYIYRLSKRFSIKPECFPECFIDSCAHSV